MALTKRDLDQIDNMIKANISINNDELEERFEKVATKLKSDFIEHINPILKEVVKNRDERTVMADKISNHDDRIGAIESHLNIAS